MATKALLKLHITQLCSICLLLSWVKQAASKRQPPREKKLFFSQTVDRKSSKPQEQGHSSREPSIPALPRDRESWGRAGEVPWSSGSPVPHSRTAWPGSTLNTCSETKGESTAQPGTCPGLAWVPLWSQHPVSPAR